MTGFESPLDMLRECHQRVQAQCRTLVRLVPHLHQHGSDQVAVDAARAVMRYFDLAAPLHHADEEADLFPALLDAVGGSDAVCLHGLIDGRLGEHIELDRQWQSIRQVLQRVASGQAALLDADIIDAFQAAYKRHIGTEENELLPMADRLLPAPVLAALGRSMQARRGVPPEGMAAPDRR
jgi:hemerythrin-like domain-containing protein